VLDAVSGSIKVKLPAERDDEMYVLFTIESVVDTFAFAREVPSSTDAEDVQLN